MKTIMSFDVINQQMNTKINKKREIKKKRRIPTER
jgi:hypothetical protein